MKIRSKILLISVIAFVLGGFVVTITYEFLDVNFNEKTYYAKSDNIDGSIDKISIDNHINIDLSGNISNYCMKTTRTKPNGSSLCWTRVSSNNLKLSYIKGKVYYIWIMDNDGNISSEYQKVVS